MKKELTTEQVKRLLLWIKNETANKVVLDYEIYKEESEIKNLETVIESIENDLDNISEDLMKYPDINYVITREENLVKNTVREGLVALAIASIISLNISASYQGNRALLAVGSSALITAAAYSIKGISERKRIEKMKWDTASKHDSLFDKIREKQQERMNAYALLTQLDNNLYELKSEKHVITSRLEKLINIKNQLVYLHGQELLIALEHEVKHEVEDKEKIRIRNK